MPGATPDSVEGIEIKGRVKVRLAPVLMIYTGTARFTERNRDAARSRQAGGITQGDRGSRHPPRPQSAPNFTVRAVTPR
jgi:hypothetical protein